MKIYMGYDQSEDKAYSAAISSLAKCSRLMAEPLDAEKLRSQGLYTRAVDKRGQMYDFPSNAPCSTDFATSRFLVPIICQSGLALFTDCDVIFMADPAGLVDLVDYSKAVMVVKHHHIGDGLKMGGMIQTNYSRKNWSSVMLFNCDHPANKRLSLRDVNERPGRDLHAFYWLNDSEIGDLPMEWNWLVNVEDKPVEPKIAHFTNGGPWIDGWVKDNHDEIWNRYGG